MQDEKRLHPRVPTDINAEVQLGLETLPVRVVNLSLGGFLIEGGGQLATISASPKTGTIEMNISFELKSYKVDSMCRVVYKRRLSFDKTALGLKIILINEEMRDQISAFVRENLI